MDVRCNVKYVCVHLLRLHTILLPSTESTSTYKKNSRNAKTLLLAGILLRHFLP